MINLILCGGSGTRLWPISRTLMPKQFVKLFDNRSLFQMTLQRNQTLCSSHMVVSNAQQYFLATNQIKEFDNAPQHVSYLLEPVAKNTAPAIALACMSLDSEDVVLVTPSDHIIKNTKNYSDAALKAKKLAQKGFMVTFGIKPTAPETGFGYIQAKGEDVLAFKEKPDVPTAQKYFNAGGYYWNSGMFCFQAGTFLQELQKYAPKIYESCQKAFENKPKTMQSDFIRIAQEDMSAIPEDSIDFAVMEQSKKVKVVPSDLDWSDLGSFDALYEHLPKDANGNTKETNHININSKNNLIYNADTSERTLATVDIEDLILVDTGDAVLVSKRGSSQKVKQVVKEIKNGQTQMHNIHLTAHRPWGTYTVLEDTPGYKIKRIEVKPGQRLSLQKHYHRNEHWIVVSGTAEVTIGDTKHLIRPNESTYIKMGQTHRLSNPGKIPVVLIEAQVGEYTEEDDIIRFSDDYERS